MINRGKGSKCKPTKNLPFKTVYSTLKTFYAKKCQRLGGRINYIPTSSEGVLIQEILSIDAEPASYVIRKYMARWMGRSLNFSRKLIAIARKRLVFRQTKA